MHALLNDVNPIPEACKENISCSCKRGCKTLSCSCKKAKLPCIGLCACSNTTPDGGNICMNHSQTCTCSNSKLDALASWIPYTIQMFINGRLEKNWTGRVFWTKNITGCSIGYRVIVSWYSVCLWKEQFVFFFFGHFNIPHDGHSW